MPPPARPHSRPDALVAVQPSAPLWKSSESTGAFQNGFVLTMSSVAEPNPAPPGAPRSTVVLPKFEKPERCPLRVTAATQIRFALPNVHGVVGTSSLSSLSLP